MSYFYNQKLRKSDKPTNLYDVIMKVRNENFCCIMLAKWLTYNFIVAIHIWKSWTAFIKIKV